MNLYNSYYPNYMDEETEVKRKFNCLTESWGSHSNLFDF